MSKAVKAATTLRATSTGQPRDGHSVHVAPLHNPAAPKAWGLYVGQTSRDPRFDQHKAGYKVRRYGVRLLPTLFAHLNPMLGWEALELEAALAEAFRAAGVP